MPAPAKCAPPKHHGRSPPVVHSSADVASGGGLHTLVVVVVVVVVAVVVVVVVLVRLQSVGQLYETLYAVDWKAALSAQDAPLRMAALLHLLSSFA